MRKTIVEIEKIVSGAYGFARDKKGNTYMVRGALEGEIVSIEEVVKKKDVSFCKVVEILKESEHRVEPFCEYFGECGGCVLQHASYEHQIDIKAQLLEEAISREGGIDNPIIKKKIKSAPETNYRLTCTFKTANGKVGFHKENSNDLVPVKECKIINNAINDIIPKLNELAEKYETLHEIKCLYSPKKNEIILSGTSNYKKHKINNPSAFERVVSRNHIKGVTLHLGNDWKNYFRKGEDSTSIQSGPYEFRVHVRSFLQNNANVFDGFYHCVSQYLRRNDDAIACDLYSGIGFFTLLLSEYFPTVVGIETDYFSYRNALKNRNTNDRKNIHFVNAPVEDEELMSKIPIKEGFHFDTMLVDPPRAGITNEAIAKIKEFLPNTLIYVSCEATTLARDIKRLAPQYTFIETNLIDSFPHTKHIESVSLFKLNPDRPREKLQIKAENYGLK